MAIQFARCAYVSRSSGGNACRKASYNQRETLRCERTGELFSFKERGGNVHHEILLPLGANEKFKDSSTLWNEVEACERRINSQVAKEFVIALPDDVEVLLADRIELTRRFGNIFVERGVAVQLDVHASHEGEKNWHAHLLVTTRRFSKDGLTFDAKARDLDPIIRSGSVVEADLWGEIWKDLQNKYFEEKGYDLRVDPTGILPQEHLGPVRMRHHLNEAVIRAQLLQKANETLAQDPKSVLEEMTRTQAVFMKRDVEFFLQKHVPFNEREGLLEKVLRSSGVLNLYEKETGQKTGYFTTSEVRAEEEKLLRFADAVSHKIRSALPLRSVQKGLSEKSLSDEQRKAYDHCVTSGENLCLIQGRAGVGKSYVLGAIRIAHETAGFRVLGLAPTHKVAMDLKEDGFPEAKTCHAFLFAFKNRRETLNSKTLVLVDEAGMLGTELSVELFKVIKTSNAKLLLVGDSRQLSSVQRGGTFGLLAERYGAVELREVRRQTIGWQKTMSEDLSKGDVRSAVRLLSDNNCISWKPTKEEALSELLKAWARGSSKTEGTRQILAQRNVDVDALNEGAREILRSRGKLGDIEITCMTQRGKVTFAEGERVQFTKTDKIQGLENGRFGVVEHINPETKILTLKMDNKETKEIDPQSYDGLRHGYAATVYKSQGSTLDHVYVLHSKTTTQSTSYVALTRQAQSLSLYVSQKETPSEAHLIRQMERQDVRGSSLSFDTLKDIEERQQDKTLTTKLIQGIETLITKVKDTFHKNKDFYSIERPKGLPHQDVSLSFSPQSSSKEASKPLPEDLKRDMLGEDAYTYIYNLKPMPKAKPNPKTADPQAIQENLKTKEEVSGQGPETHSPSIRVPQDPGAGAHQEEVHQGLTERTLPMETLPASQRAVLKESASQADTPLSHDKTRSMQLTKEYISPALQAVYKDMTHPAFKDDTFYKKVFKEGLKLYGEERAINYWHSKRGALLTLYEQKVETVAKELTTPLLAHLSEETKALARKLALEDPTRTLNLIKDHASKNETQEKPIPREDKKILENESKEALLAYYRFKELKNEFKNSPNNSNLQKEIHALGKFIVKNQEMFSHIEKMDPSVGKSIKQEAQAQIKAPSLTLNRGGFSL